MKDLPQRGHVQDIPRRAVQEYKDKGSRNAENCWEVSSPETIRLIKHLMTSSSLDIQSHGSQNIFVVQDCPIHCRKSSISCFCPFNDPIKMITTNALSHIPSHFQCKLWDVVNPVLWLISINPFKALAGWSRIRSHKQFTCTSPTHNISLCAWPWSSSQFLRACLKFLPNKISICPLPLVSQTMYKREILRSPMLL